MTRRRHRRRVPHADHRRLQGVARQRRSPRSGQARGRRGARSGRAFPPPRSTTSCWARCSRAAAASPATSPSTPGSHPTRRASPSTGSAPPACRRRRHRGGQHHGGHGPGGDRRRRRVDDPVADRRTARPPTPGACPSSCLAQPSGHARRAEHEHDDHGRREHGARRSASPASRSDEWSFGSHQKAIAAIDEGRFKDEIVPVEVTGWDGQLASFEVDEHPRRDTSLEKLAKLRVLSGVPNGTDHRRQLVADQRRRGGA